MLSIIIPTKDRPEFVERCLVHLGLCAYSGQILIADSSDLEGQEHNRRIVKNLGNKLDLDYAYYPPKDYPLAALCLDDCLRRARSKYAIHCADDDFHNLPAFPRLIDFLEANPDYIGAQGVRAEFIVSGDKAHGQIMAVNDVVRPSLEDHRPLARWLRYMKNAISLQYAVMRRDFLVSVYERSAQIQDWHMSELLPCSLIAMAGKFKVFPVVSTFFQQRGAIPDRSTHWRRPDIEDNKLRLGSILADELARIDGMSPDEASFIIRSELDAYYAVRRQNDFHNRGIQQVKARPNLLAQYKDPNHPHYFDFLRVSQAIAGPPAIHPGQRRATAQADPAATGSVVAASGPESPRGAPESPGGAPESLRLLQVHTFYDAYLNQFYARSPGLRQASWEAQIRAMVEDGFSGIHMLAPHLGPLGYEASLIVANNSLSQLAWAKEHGLRPDAGGNFQMASILRAQIESYRPDVLYLSDPITYDSRFVRSLTHAPRLVLGWRAASVPEDWDLGEFDVMLSCLPGIREMALARGARHAAHFLPGVPEAIFRRFPEARPDYDLAFIGQVNANQFQERNRRLGAIAKAAAARRWDCRFFLSGQLDSIPDAARVLDHGPVYGLDMYGALAKARIAFDGRARHGVYHRSGVTGDLGRRQTANMRIFEATGVGAFLLTQRFDNLGDMFDVGKEIETYDSTAELLDKIAYYLEHPDQREAIARAGRERCRRDHSMTARLRDFDAIVRGRLGMKTRRTASTSTSTHALIARLERLARLNPAPEPLARLLAEVMDFLRALAEGRRWDQVAALTASVKALGLPVRNLGILRAEALAALGDPAAARDALDEELRCFPDNELARREIENMKSG